MTQQDLQRQIRKRQFAPVYLFYGKETFIIERTAKRLAMEILGTGDPAFNYQLFWGTEKKPEEMAADVVNAANAFPFLAEKRIVLVREADSVLKDPRMLAYVKNPNPDTVLILTASSPARKSKSSAAKARISSSDIFAYLQSRDNAMGQDVTLEFKELRDAPLLEWIVAEFEERGRKITREAAAILLDLKGNSTGEIASEIEKVLTALPDTNEIGQGHIEALLEQSRQFDVFQLTQAVLSRNEPAAQEIARRLLTSDGFGRIVAQLAKDLTALWQARMLPAGRSTDEDARALGFASGWQLDKIRVHVPKFRGEEYFDRCFEHLLEADAALKTGAGKNPDIVLSVLIHRLTAPAAPTK
jgi:DNA polymerase III delta subunit